MHANSGSRVLVFTATYNEAANITLLCEQIWVGCPGADVLVVDDNSPDGTGKILDKLAEKYSKLKIIHRPGKLGLGSAHYIALLYAIKNDYDVLVTMDADLSHNPADIPRLISRLPGADFVIGSRYAPGGSCDYSGYRKNVSVIGNQIARMLTGINLHEFTTSFRVFDVSALSKMNFNWIGNFGYSFFLETIFRLHQAGLRLKEEPVHFYNRNAGESKIPKLEILRAIKKVSILGLSRFLPVKSAMLNQLIDGHCAHCGSNFLYQPLEDQDTNLNKSKVITIRCLQCGKTQK